MYIIVVLYKRNTFSFKLKINIMKVSIWRMLYSLIFFGSSYTLFICLTIVVLFSNQINQSVLLVSCLAILPVILMTLFFPFKIMVQNETFYHNLQRISEKMEKERKKLHIPGLFWLSFLSIYARNVLANTNDSPWLNIFTLCLGIIFFVGSAINILSYFLQQK